MLTFLDLQQEVARRSIRNQAGTEYTEEIKNILNSSLLSLAREAKWRPLRRKTTFTTIGSYTSGTGYVAVTLSSTAISLISTACDLWTDQVQIGRKVRIGTDSRYYTIKAINSNTNFVIDSPYRGTSATRTNYEIYPQEEYSLPIQVDHRSFLWHEDYGYPYLMYFIPDQSFFKTGSYLSRKATPTHYRMWGENMVNLQVPTSTPLMLVSSSAVDTTQQVTIFGNVAGFPQYEVVTLGGTTSTRTVLEFESVERISKNNSTTGTITVTASRSTYALTVLPAGDTTATVKYSKVQIHPLPTRVFDVNVYYYKEPYRLVNDGDIHEMGQEFDEALILLSVAKIKYQDSQAEGDRFLQLYATEVSSLKKYNVDKIDWQMVLKRPKEDRVEPFVSGNLLYKQAGPYFGPSSRL